MIVDGHVHFWEAPTADRPYDDEFPRGGEEVPMPVEALLEAAASAGVDQVVQVTQAKMGYDNRYSFEGATRYAERVLGVVGRIDPLQPRIEHALGEFMQQPKAIGVRFTLLTDSTRNWIRHRVLDKCLIAARKLDVPVHLYAPSQFSEMRELARRFPEVRFVVDHMGLRNRPVRRADEVYREWPSVLALAGERNVWTKVSFFPEASHGSETYPFAGAQARFRELYEHVGALRLIWGSNYPPVETVGACTYREAVDFVRIHCAFLTAEERDAILGANFLRLAGRTT